MISKCTHRVATTLLRSGISVPKRLYTPANNQIPFELDETDEKYKELNNIYRELFTPTDKANILTTKDIESNKRSEVDEINEELNSLYSVGVLSPAELEDAVKSNGRFVIRSVSTNPYFNLALEDYVFRNTPLTENKTGNERILLYTNDKCVVVGKNQNPWKETYMRNIASRGYNFVRRRSGGGAVVHDLGNVNYSYLTSRESFRREFFNQQLVQWLSNENITLNDRGDLIYKGYKISGSAFKIAKGKAYHHGTMLIDSDLAQFKGLLKPDVIPGVEWTCNSVESVRSKVDNIGGKAISSIDDFCNLITDQFRNLVDDSEIPMFYCDESSSLLEITEISENLRSKEWKFMSGPRFEVICNDVTIKVEKGVIIESDWPELVGMPFYKFYDEVREDDKIFKHLL
ncbi:putative lipoate--protein ligase [Kluyveromyces lactis]|uniref:Putative lipoate-protein ligase A n=1 Tax=Kluyveromyces lactis (strain ATCC 8585 / CBS 2359 / DSM 70799 / NBRC 1267 / NRRL Y-1140 / WM37) TaxID=284590 RepID=Q6CLK8_KLULA|nr:uncharacterized protein KLLA0_F02233g [Kluyveromyces lactis]CAG97888.1 KLLA0F02233p [Kluyveromyces lactis]|eukprot:XP_455181.1 uncharacterized protein KLLA0_F02233g [Kluyveromyces lactis]